MRPLTIGIALFLGPCLAFSACGQDPASQATSSSGTGGVPNCDDVTIVNGEDAGNNCDVCLHKHCCAEIAICTDAPCLDCVNYHFMGCELNSHAQTVTKCLLASCHDPCYPGLSTSSGAGGSGGGTSSSSSG